MSNNDIDWYISEVYALIAVSQNVLGLWKKNTTRIKYVIKVTLYFMDQFSLLTSCLLACILLAYWLFISTYKAHINALL